MGESVIIHEMLCNDVYSVVFVLREQLNVVKICLEVCREFSFLMKCCIAVFVKF